MKSDIKAVILTAAVGGRRPPSGSRRKTAPRSKDRGGHSGFSRWAGGRPPEDRRPAQRESPFNNEAGSEWSRRSCRGATGATVQWHPSRFSLSAQQTVKIFVGPCLGAPALPMPVAWAVQGPPGAPRQPFLPSWFWQWTPPETGWREGGRNPHGGAASSAAMADTLGQRETGGKPPAPLF
ncbi:hypothetical protein NDU88_001888 [Pleurodeles waltl]|uniref:Uncharacterized protein n=1 Tax=Pleurodeles waltl TaxID=8319 RepID=A0AAV7T0S0_PLEWA|nr:hypothetical protein NDU88_001888 [Pleurodeles waltl]